MQSLKFSRRRVVAMGLGASFAPSIALAQSIDFMGTAPGQSPEKSTQDFLPYRVVRVSPMYKSRVVELIEFTCPYCRQINGGAQAWGNSLPKPFVFEQMPLVFDKTTAEIAGIYYTAVLANPQIKADIVSSMFHAVQDLHENASDPRTYVKAAAAAGVTLAEFSRATKDNKGREAYIERAAAFALAVKPRATPTFVVDGKAMDAVDTGGDYQKLFQLLNGFTSEAMNGLHGAR